MKMITPDNWKPAIEAICRKFARNGSDITTASDDQNSLIVRVDEKTGRCGIWQMALVLHRDCLLVSKLLEGQDWSSPSVQERVPGLGPSDRRWANPCDQVQHPLPASKFRYIAAGLMVDFPPVKACRRELDQQGIIKLS